MKLQGVIFDIDGTLIDSNDAHAHAWVQALAENGFEVEFGRIRKLIGMGGDKLLPEVTGLHKDEPKGKQITERRAQIFKQYYLPMLRPFPRTKELLSRMQNDGLKLVIATSAQPEELTGMLKVARIEGFFQAAAQAEDAPKSKPDPDVVQAALRKSGLHSDEVIMLGDTPYDVEGATRAGVKIIAVRSGGWQDADFKDAIAIYNDPADLLNHYDTSPIAQP